MNGLNVADCRYLDHFTINFITQTQCQVTPEVHTIIFLERFIVSPSRNQCCTCQKKPLLHVILMLPRIECVTIRQLCSNTTHKDHILMAPVKGICSRISGALCRDRKAKHQIRFTLSNPYLTREMSLKMLHTHIPGSAAETRQATLESMGLTFSGWQWCSTIIIFPNFRSACTLLIVSKWARAVTNRFTLTVT